MSISKRTKIIPKDFPGEVDLGVDIDIWLNNDRKCSRDRMPGEGNYVSIVTGSPPPTFPDSSRTFHQVLKSFITLVFCEKTK